jgi:hypothetical protein
MSFSYPTLAATFTCSLPDKPALCPPPHIWVLLHPDGIIVLLPTEALER